MRVFNGRQAQKQEIHGGLEMKCGKWYDMVHPVQKRWCILYKKYIGFLIYYYIIYNIADTKKQMARGSAASAPVRSREFQRRGSFFIDRKDGEIRNIRGKQQMNEAQRAKVMQIIDKHGRS